MCHSDRVRDISGSLTRQSLLVAGTCLVADVGLFLIVGPSVSHGWRVWLVIAATVAVDAALAGPARSSGVMAVAHAALVVVTPVLLAGHGPIKAPNNAGGLIAGYRAGAWLRSPSAVLALAAMIAGQIGGHLVTRDRTTGNWWLLGINVLISAVLPWLVGRYTTARRAYLDEIDRQAERREHHERAAVQRAVAEERSAIARDLHDVISHHVSAIGVHAGAARMSLPTSPDPGTDTGPDAEPEAGPNTGPDTALHRSLSAVESASRAAMADLRRLLDLLHGQNTDAAQRQPGLDNLDELLDGLRAAGLPVRLAIHGGARPLPGSVDIALYRIAQESLTNTLRHGDGGPVDVELAYRPDGVTFSVTNPFAHRTTAPNGDSPHRGLTGIRQRVALFGGDASYGPCSDGRLWRLAVSFPLEHE